ncbi:MAG: hypothetical protein HOK35_17825 [Cytophagia bacterium]|nr:hypothetical protein [Cytophagia bacterium]
MLFHRIKIFRLIFLMIILFGYGVQANTITVIEEPSIPTNNQENNMTIDNDTIDDDQISQTDDFCSLAKLNSEISILQNYFLIPQTSISIWQPPKIF